MSWLVIRLILYKLNGLNEAVVAEADALLALDNPDLDTLYATLENKRMTFRTQVRLEQVLAWERAGLTEETEKAFTEWIAIAERSRRHGFYDVPIDGEDSAKLREALAACFGLRACYQPVMHAI